MGLDDPEVAFPPRETSLEVHDNTMTMMCIVSAVWMGNVFDKQPKEASKGIGPTGYNGNTNLGVKPEDPSRSGTSPWKFGVHTDVAPLPILSGGWCCRHERGEGR